MSIKEKFRKRIKHRCPDCDCMDMKIVDIIDDENGASYVETFRICDECGCREEITDKRNGVKVEVVEEVSPKKPWKSDKEDKDKFRYRR